MEKTYPDKVSINLVENMDKFSTHFTQYAECRNCKTYIGGIFIKKGLVVKEYEKTLTCSNCEVTGLISIW